MARKTRKRRPRRPPPERPNASAESAPPAPPAARQARRAAPDERPPAPWGRFPLVELAVLVGLIILVWGFASSDATRVVVGLILCSLGGLEISIREHFAGYRSHTLILSGAAGVGLLVLFLFAVPSLWLPLALVLSLALFAATFWWLTGVFRRQAGVSFRIRPPRRG
jgi:uncharacterized membrane protein HdeD (DUF308 family)